MIQQPNTGVTATSAEIEDDLFRDNHVPSDVSFTFYSPFLHQGHISLKADPHLNVFLRLASWKPTVIDLYSMRTSPSPQLIHVDQITEHSLTSLPQLIYLQIFPIFMKNTDEKCSFNPHPSPYPHPHTDNFINHEGTLLSP